MTAALHLAGVDDIERLLPLVAAYHELEGVEQDDASRRAAVMPLLEGSPHGAVWLVGLRRAPVGYVAVSFGWSIEFGGMDGIVDEFFIRENVRGRGMGSEVLASLQATLAAAGLKALHFEAGRRNAAARTFYERRGFLLREGYHLMSWRAPDQG